MKPRKHFQHLTCIVGEPHVDKQLAVVTTLLRLSDNPAGFDEIYQRALGKDYQTRFNFPEPPPLVIDIATEQ